MSIENDLSRIALALEKISLMGMNIPNGNTPVTTSSEAPTTTLPLQAGVAPSQEVLTPEALKIQAQKFASGLSAEEVMNFTNYVRGFVCSRFGVKKLGDIPADKVNEALTYLKEFDKKVNYTPSKGS